MTNRELLDLHELVTRSINAWDVLTDLADQLDDDTLRQDAHKLDAAIGKMRRHYTEDQVEQAQDAARNSGYDRVSRDKLVSALYKWAGQNSQPIGELIDADGHVCCLGMIARECLGVTDSDLRHDKENVMGLLDDYLSEDLCSKVMFICDDAIRTGRGPRGPHGAAVEILNAYDEQDTR